MTVTFCGHREVYQPDLVRRWLISEVDAAIESILVLAYLDQKADASGYDGTTYPPLENVPRRYAIAKRNRKEIRLYPAGQR